MTTNNPLLNEALGYAERGWYVFPTREVPSKPFLHKGETVIRPTKAPYISGGLNSSTRDASTIKEWWARYPNAGIGVDCGKSNLIVLDLDVRDGKKGYETFLSLGLSTEGTLQSMTPSGGLHIIFEGQMSTYKDDSGLDVRSNGGYIVAPPSWIIDGGKKCYYKKLGDWSNNPVTAPAILPELLGHTRCVSNNITKNTNRVSNENPDKLKTRVEKALFSLPVSYSDDRDYWVKFAMALKNDLGDLGFDVWDRWSQRSSKYKATEMRYLWDKMTPSNITVATIFYESKVSKK